MKDTFGLKRREKKITQFGSFFSIFLPVHLPPSNLSLVHIGHVRDTCFVT